MPIKLTIDSNIINLKGANPDINSLEELHSKGLIELVGTERLLEEMKGYNMDALNKAKNYRNISEPFVVGVSRIGQAYISSDNDSLPSFRNLASIIFPDKNIDDLSENEENDIMHLLAHCHSDSAIFVTNNTKDFINGKRTNENRKESLENSTRKKLRKLKIEIRTPTEILTELKTMTSGQADSRQKEL